MSDLVPASVVTTAGRFRDNRRGNVRVDETALGMVEIVVELPPADGADAVTTRIVVAGDHLRILAREISRAARRDRLQAVAS